MYALRSVFRTQHAASLLVGVSLFRFQYDYPFSVYFPPLRQGRCRFATEGWIVFRSNRFSFSFISLVSPLRSLSCVASDYSSDSVVCIGILRSLRPLREIKTIAFLFCTQRARRAQSLSLCVSRWCWSGRKLRYDKRAQRVYPPPPPCGVLTPVSGGESVTTLRKPIVPLRQGRRREWINRSTLIRSPLKSCSPFILSLQVGISLTVVTTPSLGRVRGGSAHYIPCLSIFLYNA